MFSCVKALNIYLIFDSLHKFKTTVYHPRDGWHQLDAKRGFTFSNDIKGDGTSYAKLKSYIH